MSSEETRQSARQTPLVWRILKAVLKWSLVLLLLASLVLAACIVFRVPLPLEILRPWLESVAEETLGHGVSLNGPLRLVIGRKPEITVSGIGIANPEGYAQKDMASIGRLEGQFDLIALFDRRIHVNKLELYDVGINLEEHAGGSNWEFAAVVEPETGPDPAPTAETEPFEIIGVDLAGIKNMVLVYSNRVEQSTHQLEINQLGLTAAAGTPISVEGSGAYQGEDWTLDMSSGSLDQLLQNEANLPINLDATYFSSMVTTELNILRSETPVRVDGDISIDRMGPAKVVNLMSNGDDAPVDLVELLQPLKLLNGSLDIRIGAITGLPISVNNAEFSLLVEDGNLDVPISVEIDDQPITAQLAASLHEDAVSFTADFNGDNIDVGSLAARHIPGQDVTGQASSIHINVAAQGHYLADTSQTAELDIQAGATSLSFGNDGIDERVDLNLNDFSLHLGPASPLNANISGTLLQGPFSLQLSGPTLLQLLDEDRWQVVLKGKTEAFDLVATGQLEQPTETSESSVEIQITGDHVGELAAWAGVNANARMQYQFDARFALTATSWGFNLNRASLGNSAFRGSLSGNRAGTRSPVDVALHFDYLDVGELSSTFLAEEESAPASLPVNDGTSTAAAGSRVAAALEVPEAAMQGLQDAVGEISLKAPLYPQGINLPDANFWLSVDDLALEEENIRDILVSGQVQNGIIDSAEVAATLPGMELRGGLSFNPVSTPSNLSFRLASDNADVGMLMDELDITEDLVFTAGHIDMDINLTGPGLERMLETSEVTANIRDALWVLEDPNDTGALNVEIHEGTFTMTPDDGIQFLQQTSVRGIPSTLRLTASHPAKSRDQQNLAVELDFEAPNIRFIVGGDLSLPVSSSELDLTINAEAENLKYVNALFGLDLPAYGPLSLDTSFRLRPESYRFEDMRIKVGSSEIGGTLEVHTAEDVPRVVAALVATELQLLDFFPEDDAPAEAHGSATFSEMVMETDQTVSQIEDRAQQDITSTQELMQSLNARIDLKVDQVMSGEDHLGKGNAVLVLEDGRLSVDPLDLDLPGGRFEASIDVLAVEDEFQSRVTAYVNEFDFGVIARRFQPDTQMGGTLYLDVDLQSRHPEMVRILPNANGKFDMALKPENFQSGVIDLWATGVLSAVMPTLDSSDDSVFNCIIARLDATDGILRDQLIVADTSKIRIRGHGEINLRERKLDLDFRPTSKRPQFYSLSNPVRVTGDLDSINTSIPPLSWVATALRWSVAYIVVPIQILFGNRMPEDGSDICVAPMQRAP